MQSQPEKHLYEYAVIRYVPVIERGEQKIGRAHV